MYSENQGQKKKKWKKIRKGANSRGDGIACSSRETGSTAKFIRYFPLGELRTQHSLLQPTGHAPDKGEELGKPAVPQAALY